MVLAASYQNFRSDARRATAATCCAVTIFVLPLIAMVCGLLTLRLPGMTLYKLRHLLIPAGALFGASIPLIALAVITNRSRNRSFTPYLNELKKQVDQMPLSKQSTKIEKQAFLDLLIKDLVKPYEATDFRYFILTQLSEGYPKDSPKQKAILAARNKSLDS